MLLFVVRCWRPTGCGKRRQRVPISKAEFSSQVSSGIPLAPSPADPSPCREALSDSNGGLIADLALIGETKVGAVDPHAMENDADFAGKCDLGSFGAAAFGDGDGPGLELRPLCDTGHQYVVRLEQSGPHCGIAGAADGAGSIDLAGLIAPGRQAKTW